MDITKQSVRAAQKRLRERETNKALEVIIKRAYKYARLPYRPAPERSPKEELNVLRAYLPELNSLRDKLRAEFNNRNLFEIEKEIGQVQRQIEKIELELLKASRRL